MNEQELTPEKLYEFLVYFTIEFKQVPYAGFLAGYFKTSKRRIYHLLEKLEKQELIRKKSSGNEIMDYEVLIKKD